LRTPGPRWQWRRPRRWSLVKREPDGNRRNDGQVVILRRRDEVQITGNGEPNKLSDTENA
jgi:hypothetical protein